VKKMLQIQSIILLIEFEANISSVGLIVIASQS